MYIHRSWDSSINSNHSFYRLQYHIVSKGKVPRCVILCNNNNNNTKFRTPHIKGRVKVPNLGGGLNEFIKTPSFKETQNKIK